MTIDRRTFLIGSVVTVGAAALGGRPSSAAPPAIYASACRRETGTYAVALLDAQGRIVSEHPLAARGHDIAWCGRSGTAVAFGRQPGRFAVAFRPDGAGEPSLFAPPENRAFFGHGVFSPDGRLLYTTENDLDEGTGRIGIYDATDRFTRIGEMSSGGIGPHEVVVGHGGDTLVIANGGYETLPETGRQPIDIAGMRPSLVFLNRTTGAIEATHELPASLRPLSIRHLAVDGRGNAWFGGQWEGNSETTPALVGHAALDRPVTLLDAFEPLGRALKGYIGSVAMGRDGATLAVAAPRAGRTLLIDTASGAIAREILLPDGCGIAPTNDGFALSSGHGRLLAHQKDGADATLADIAGLAFDNHLRWIAA